MAPSRKRRDEIAHLGLSSEYDLALVKVINANRVNDHESFPIKEDEMKARKIFTFLRDKKGIAVPITAISIVMLLTIVAVVIDLGRLYVIKAELQNAADAGASAGAQALFLNPDQLAAQGLLKFPAQYPSTTSTGAIVPALWQPSSSPRMVVADGVISPDVFADNLLPFTRVASQLSIILAAVTPPVEQTLTSCDYARAAARHTVEANNAEGKSLSINDADIDLGVWKQNSATNNWEFESQSCTNSTNAVKVETRKDEAINGPVNLIFAQILGIESKELKAQSIAMLGWVKGIGLGKGAFPLALGDKNVPPPGGKLPVTFSSNNTDTGAWQTFSDPSASADSVTKLVNGTTPSPAIKCEDMIYVTNGVAASVLQEIYKEFYVVHGGDWTVILPVIGTESNYTGQKKVKGFCAFKITEVKQSPENSVSGYSLGGYIVPNAEPGGPDYGLKAGIAKLVR